MASLGEATMRQNARFLQYLPDTQGILPKGRQTIAQNDGLQFENIITSYFLINKQGLPWLFLARMSPRVLIPEA
jgi:hypothetical protein